MNIDKRKINNGYEVIVKSWSAIDEKSMEQVYNLASAPYVSGPIAVMPDVHFGYGVPIGTVFATDGELVPNAVGVDIGCLDKDTEFLTQTGWKKINKYNENDLVLQYNKESDEANFVKPINYIVKPCEEFYWFKNNKGLDQMLSEEHKMLVWKGFKGRGYNMEDFTPVQMVNKSFNSGFYGVKTSFNIHQKGIDFTDDEIRLLIMISADGCVREEKQYHNKIELHFKKDRKIKRAYKILNRLDITYVSHLNKNNTVSIVFFVDKKITKELSILWYANKDQLKIVTEECLLWDGHKGYRSSFSSTNKENADIIQFAFISTNIRAGIFVQNQKQENWNTVYCVIPTRNNIVGFKKPVLTKSEDHKKYCFTVPSGYFVARRDGKVFITGNCGVRAVEFDIEADSLSKIYLIKILQDIRNKIPVGFSHRTQPVDSGKLPLFDDDLSFYPVSAGFEKSNILHQLGTLGGGNHFIEFQKCKETGKLWLMIHSGSRNLGLKVAKHYNILAKEMNKIWYSNLSQCADLAFLSFCGNEYYDNYFSEMTYCVKFAERNREIIAQDCIDIIGHYASVNIESVIDTIHNYAISQHGKMIHRKGAVHAPAGKLVAIPGSQGSKSYIGIGLGNPDSYESCSHGAGRKYGRNEARKILDLKTEQNKMKNIVHGMTEQANLDEAPGAYKDIDDVMNEQKTLVTIKDTLIPLGVVKDNKRK